MDTNYYTRTIDFLGRHKDMIASIRYWPGPGTFGPEGFAYEFVPREKIDPCAIDSLVRIFNALVKNAHFAGISEDEKRHQIISAFAMYNVMCDPGHPVYKVVSPPPLPRVNDADVKEYMQKDFEQCCIPDPEELKNMLFAELKTPAPTFTARKVGTVHYLPDAKKIIFKGPATIILWADKTKTVVKCMDGDAYDPEKAVLMAYLEKLAGGKGPAKRFLKGSLAGKDYTPQGVNDARTQELATAEKVRLVRELLETMACSEAAKALGISESTVRRVRKKKENEA